MVVKITSSTIPKTETVYFCTVLVLHVAGTNGNTCRRELKEDEKQLIDLEWPSNIIKGGERLPKWGGGGGGGLSV